MEARVVTPDGGVGFYGGDGAYDLREKEEKERNVEGCFSYKELAFEDHSNNP